MLEDSRILYYNFSRFFSTLLIFILIRVFVYGPLLYRRKTLLFCGKFYTVGCMRTKRCNIKGCIFALCVDYVIIMRNLFLTFFIECNVALQIWSWLQLIFPWAIFSSFSSFSDFISDFMDFFIIGINSICIILLRLFLGDFYISLHGFGLVPLTFVCFLFYILDLWYVSCDDT